VFVQAGGGGSTGEPVGLPVSGPAAAGRGFDFGLKTATRGAIPIA
jgi:hypothetical protein